MLHLCLSYSLYSEWMKFWWWEPKPQNSFCPLHAGPCLETIFFFSRQLFLLHAWFAPTCTINCWILYSMDCHAAISFVFLKLPKNKLSHGYGSSKFYNKQQILPSPPPKKKGSSHFMATLEKILWRISHKFPIKEIDLLSKFEMWQDMRWFDKGLR